MTAPGPQASAPARSSSGDESGDYSFTFSRQGEEVQATFSPRFIPRDDSIFISATRAVIRRAYGEETSGSPSPAGRAIRFDGANHTFMVTPIKQDTGEIHSLVITRESRK